MTDQSDNQIKLDELAIAQVGDIDQILDGHLAEILEMEWNKAAINSGQQLCQQHTYSDSDQLTRRLQNSFSRRKELIHQSSTIVSTA